MDDKLVCKAMMEFVGLDEESTKSQILPYLKSLKTTAEAQGYLESLIGQGQKQAEFIQRFSNSILRKKPEATRNFKNEAAFPSLPSAQRTPQSSSHINLGFPTMANRPKIRQTQSVTKARAISDHQNNNSNNKAVDPPVYNNFGNPANVYIKAKDSEVTTSHKKRNTKSATMSESVTPEPKPNPINQPVQPAKPREMTTKTDPKSGDLPLDIDIPISEMSPSILKEILEVKSILESIDSPNTFPKGTAQCFCGARTHGQPLSRLPKQCVNCGLIYCRLKPALSACPSCNETSRLSTNPDLRENIRSEFINTRNSLIKNEIEKYKKRLSLEKQREALAREAERDYPTLPAKPSTSNRSSTRTTSTSNTPSYSNKLDSSNAIQKQIKSGYERLAQEFEKKSAPAPDSQSKSHTVVRLHPNGKTKIITTVQKKTKDPKLPSQQQETEIKLDQFINSGFSAVGHLGTKTAFIDQYDDLFRVSSQNLEPILFIEKSLSPVVPKYVPIDIYQV